MYPYAYIILFYSLCLVSYTSVRAVSPLGLLWTNWDGIQSSSPSSYMNPTSEDQIVPIIQSSYHKNQSVKVIGAGLSFSGIQLSNQDTAGKMISFDHYNKVLNVEYTRDGALVEVQSGIQLRDLCIYLEGLNLSFVNLGATATQSLAGATGMLKCFHFVCCMSYIVYVVYTVATGTHGTGLSLGNLASQIRALRMIDSRGNIILADTNTNKELYDAARVGLGAVGIISTMTIHVVPLWKMHVYPVHMALSDVLLGDTLSRMLTQYARIQWSFQVYTSDVTFTIREDVDNDTPLYPPGVYGGC